MIVTLLDSWSGTPTRTIGTIVVDQRNVPTDGRADWVLSFPETIDNLVYLQNTVSGPTNTGGFVHSGAVSLKWGNSFLLDPLNVQVSPSVQFDTAGRHIAYTQATYDNPHLFPVAGNGNWDFGGWIIETHNTGDGGDYLLFSGQTGTVNVSDVLVLDEGNPGALINSLSVLSDPTLTLEKSTQVRKGATGGGYGFVKGEAGGTWGGDVTVRSLLNVDLSGAGNSNVVRLIAGDNQLAALDYNAQYDFDTPYFNVSGSSPPSPGANDVTLAGDPFVDSSRTLGTWATTVRGHASFSDYLDALALFGRDGFDSADNPFAADSAFDWVRAGYVVIDAALNGTAHDGGVIGAMGYQAQSAGGSGSVGLSTGMIGGIGKLGAL